MRIVRVKDWRIIAALDRVCFPTSEPPEFGDGTVWLLARDVTQPIGYCGFKVLQDATAYFNRVGVLPQYRGQGVHAKLLRARLRRARAMGCDTAITYTMADNYPSANNLMDAGFRLYNPAFPWVGTGDVLYWRRSL